MRLSNSIHPPESPHLALPLSNAAAPESRPGHSNTHLCGVKITEYFQNSTKTKSLRVCKTCKGYMVLELLGYILDTEPDQTSETLSTSLAALANGKLSATKTKAIQNHVWKACALEPFHKLKRCRPPWNRCLDHIAKELAKNINHINVQELIPSLGQDPDSAYEWWKKRNEERVTRVEIRSQTQPSPVKPCQPAPQPPTVTPSIRRTTDFDLARIEQNLISLLQTTHSAVKSAIVAETRYREIQIDSPQDRQSLEKTKAVIEILCRQAETKKSQLTGALKELTTMIMIALDEDGKWRN